MSQYATPAFSLPPGKHIATFLRDCYRITYFNTYYLDLQPHSGSVHTNTLLLLFITLLCYIELFTLGSEGASFS